MTNIIIPTLNAEKQLPGLLKALKSQTVLSEIIIVDSSSSDNTVRIAESFGVKTLIIKREEFDHGGTRNLGGKIAKGDIPVYLTQDAVPFNEYAIENLIKPFEDKKTGAVFGRQLPCPDSTLFGAHLRSFNYPESSYIRILTDKLMYKIKTPFLSNSFAAYRKQALEEVGSFKENLIYGEDTYAGAKLLMAGYKIAYVSDAVVYHSHNYTVFQEFKRYFDLGVFHKREKWILEEFGRAEGEGKRYVKSEMFFLFKNRKYHLLLELFIRNGLKFAGYNLGKNYEKIPKGIIKRISMHRYWWK